MGSDGAAVSSGSRSHPVNCEPCAFDYCHMQHLSKSRQKRQKWSAAHHRSPTTATVKVGGGSTSLGSTPSGTPDKFQYDLEPPGQRLTWTLIVKNSFIEMTQQNVASRPRN